MTFIEFSKIFFPPDIFNYLQPYLIHISGALGPIMDTWIFPLFKAWWWFPLPFILYKPYLYLWLRSRKEKFWSELGPIVLEVKIPSEIEKPIKAMEIMFNGIWMLFSPPNPREKWLEGQTLVSISFEIVGIDGQAHFFIRVQQGAMQNMIESLIYSQYPDAEITRVRDYTSLVPQDIPNKDWELWGTDYQIQKLPCYPLKTYKDFETGMEKEEKRVDPMAGLLEAIAKLKPGEQLWVQFNVVPDLPSKKWVEEAVEEINKIVKRPKPSNGSSLSVPMAAVNLLTRGEAPDFSVTKEEEKGVPELKLTPGEREIVRAIEAKIGQYLFHCGIRFIYLGKKEAFFKANLKLPMGFLNSYSTLNLNSVKPFGKTITKRKTLFWFFDKRNEFVRKRHLFRQYVERDSALGPRESGPASFMLSAEEIASFVHFPGRMVAPAPSVTRIEAKKSEAPTALPTE